MAHGHGHESAVHGKDYVPVPAVHPAGASDSASHHGHTIVPATTLMLVLIALVAMTFLTVGAALIEKFIVEAFHVQPELATIINVSICLTIAAVKTTLVVMFFMQLKYDNPINAMIFIFCLGTVATFLGFTMLDLGNRKTIDPFKGIYVTEGGMGLTTKAFESAQAENPGVRPITELARDAAIINQKYHPEAHAHGHGPARSKHSSPNQSRPVRGMPDETEEHH